MDIKERHHLTKSIFHRKLIGRSMVKKWNTTSFVQRLKLTKQLKSHSGCVNTLQFDSTGNLLISGSDDKMLKIFDPRLRQNQLLWSFKTKHFSNIFSASFLKGLTYACSCSRDGEVRLTHITRKTSAVAFRHEKTAYRTMASGPFAPNIFYSCSDDKTVRHFDLRASTCCQGACIELSDSGISTFSIHPFDETKILIGCSDDPIVKLYDLRYSNGSNNQGKMADDDKRILAKYAPHHLLSAQAKESGKLGRVTCVKFNTRGDEFIASYSNEHVYIFDVINNISNSDTSNAKNGICGYVPKATSKHTSFRLGRSWSDCGPLSNLPQNNTTSTSSNNNNNNRQIDNCSSSIESHNNQANIINNAFGTDIPLIITNNNDVEIENISNDASDNNTYQNDDDETKVDIDTDNENSNNNDNLPNKTIYPDIESIMSPKQSFKGHRNSRTVIKEATFFGLNDEFVVSGSDDGRVYFWLKATGRLIQALNADNRVVNCVQRPANKRRGHHPLPYLCTSGIDYDIKCWEPTNTSLTRRSGGGKDALQLNLPNSVIVEDLDAIALKNEKMRIEALKSPDVSINTAQLMRVLAAMRIQRRLQRRREERVYAVSNTDNNVTETNE